MDLLLHLLNSGVGNLAAYLARTYCCAGAPFFIAGAMRR